MSAINDLCQLPHNLLVQDFLHRQRDDDGVEGFPRVATTSMSSLTFLLGEEVGDAVERVPTESAFAPSDFFAMCPQ
jgi:hypothetical protein